MRTFALDTSSQHTSLALCEGSIIVGEYAALNRLHTERVLMFLDRMLGDADWSVQDLDGFAVVNGPGSFTGIRIGLAIMQGLAFATGRPAVSLSSLKAHALGVPPVGIPICPVLDARKGEIYTALYEWRSGELKTILPEQVVAPARFVERLEGQVLFVGDGVDAMKEALEARSGVSKVESPGGSSPVRASVVARWAITALQSFPDGEVPDLKPCYLRESAEDLRLRRATASCLAPVP